MSEKPDPARAARLREAREVAKFSSAAEAADAKGFNLNTYRANENGNATFSFKKAKEYAQAFGVRVEWLYEASGPAFEGRESRTTAGAPDLVGEPIDLAEIRIFLKSGSKSPLPPPPGRLKALERRIPVVGVVEAGIWREAAALTLQEVTDFLPMEVRGYERALLRALKVAGPSMNLVYPEGRFVVVADPAEAGVRTGDYVVVERYKLDVVEITLGNRVK